MGLLVQLEKPTGRAIAKSYMLDQKDECDVCFWRQSRQKHTYSTFPLPRGRLKINVGGTGLTNTTLLQAHFQVSFRSEARNLPGELALSAAMSRFLPFGHYSRSFLTRNDKSLGVTGCQIETPYVIKAMHKIYPLTSDKCHIKLVIFVTFIRYGFMLL
jgi:hypothetical protein